jgi:hypothetical protein
MSDKKEQLDRIEKKLDELLEMLRGQVAARGGGNGNGPPQ